MRRAVRVLYSDVWFTIVDKPSGVLTVPGRREGSLEWNAAAACLKWCTSSCDHASPGLFSSLASTKDFHDTPTSSHRIEVGAASDIVVHRLDGATSGLLVFATQPASVSGLGTLFQRRQISKVYEAVLDTRHAAPDSPLHPSSVAVGNMGTISTPLGRNAHVPLLQEAGQPVHVDPAHGQPHQADEGTAAHKHSSLRPAVTHWRVLEVGDGAARVEFRPVTGRTHQLRLHAALPWPLGLGCPILGDSMYGDPTLAAHSYLHELVQRYDTSASGSAADETGQAVLGVAARLLQQATDRTSQTPVAGIKHVGVTLPYLASCPFLDHARPTSLSSSASGLPRLLLHARELAMPDHMDGTKDGRLQGLHRMGMGSDEQAVEALRNGHPASFLSGIPSSRVPDLQASAVEDGRAVDVRHRTGVGMGTDRQSTPSGAPPLVEPYVEDYRPRCVDTAGASGVESHELSSSAASNSDGRQQAGAGRVAPSSRHGQDQGPWYFRVSHAVEALPRRADHGTLQRQLKKQGKAGQGRPTSFSPPQLQPGMAHEATTGNGQEAGQDNRVTPVRMVHLYVRTPF